MVAFNPKERTHARTSKSEPAFVAEYGEDGLYLDTGVNFSSRLVSSNGKSP